MRSYPRGVARSCLCLGLFIALLARSQTQSSSQPVAVRLSRSHTVLLIVPIRINGAGPYKFVLDTGTNISLIESSLFRQLGLEPQGSVSSGAVAGMRLGSTAVAREISIDASISLKNVQVLEVDGIKRTDLGRDVRGVLGENFAQAFDLLIDNHRRQITFDSGDTLASSLSGEQLPLGLFTSVQAGKLRNRPIVTASVPSFDPDHSLQMVVDTASEGAYVLPRPGNTPQHSIAGSVRHPHFDLLNGATVCATWKGKIVVGQTTTGDIPISSCGAPVTSDHDGQLPTFLFDRVFISHRHGYLILNPSIIGGSM